MADIADILKAGPIVAGLFIIIYAAGSVSAHQPLSHLFWWFALGYFLFWLGVFLGLVSAMNDWPLPLIFSLIITAILWLIISHLA